jgi:hypothetical protein
MEIAVFALWCASGSQLWNGAAPALMAKPANINISET